MRAKSTIFTHFSARYGRMPFFSQCDYVNNNILFAYDFMYWNEKDTSVQNSAKLLKNLNVAYKKKHLENDGDRSKKRFKT